MTSVGAGLRHFSLSGEPVLFGYPESEMASGGRGQVLAPWPNRLEDGTYSFEGISAKAALDEPEHHNAIHGLVRWLEWEVARRSETAVTMAVRLAAQPGYPFGIDLSLTYELAPADTLAVRLTATNRSGRRAPFGVGFHPYVEAGKGGVDSMRLQLRAKERLTVNERGLPTGREAVEGGAYDFSAGKLIGQVHLDDCFTGIERGGQPSELAVVTRADGRAVRLEGTGELAYLMCYTGDTLAPADRRRALALEPMSCPPNALASGESLAVLEPAGTPGDSWSAGWSISAPGW